MKKTVCAVMFLFGWFLMVCAAGVLESGGTFVDAFIVAAIAGIMMFVGSFVIRDRDTQKGGRRG